MKRNTGTKLVRTMTKEEILKKARGMAPGIYSFVDIQKMLQLPASSFHRMVTKEAKARLMHDEDGRAGFLLPDPESMHVIETIVGNLRDTPSIKRFKRVSRLRLKKVLPRHTVRVMVRIGQSGKTTYKKVEDLQPNDYIRFTERGKPVVWTKEPDRSKSMKSAPGQTVIPRASIPEDAQPSTQTVKPLSFTDALTVYQQCKDVLAVARQKCEALLSKVPGDISEDICGALIKEVRGRNENIGN